MSDEIQAVGVGGAYARAIGAAYALNVKSDELSPLFAAINEMRDEYVARGVNAASVERMAKWMCRHEVPDSAPLDEVAWRMTKWERFIPEARAALIEALKETP